MIGLWENRKMVIACCSVATGGGGSVVLQLNQHTYAKHLPSQRSISCLVIKSKFVGCTVDNRLGWLRLSKIGLLTSAVATSASASGATCWFKFGKNGVDAEQAGIYGSQSRDDFDRDDVEQVLLSHTYFLLLYTHMLYMLA